MKVALSRLRSFWNGLLPGDRILAAVGIAIGAILLTKLFETPPRPLTAVEQLSEVERGQLQYWPRQNGQTDEDIAKLIISIRPSAEDKRRYDFERKRREADIQSIQANLCKEQPYLDRCR